MTEKSPICYENPDGTYNLGAEVVSFATAEAHLRKFYAEHPEAKLPAEDESVDSPLPHAS